MYQDILTEIDAGIGIVTLNRPERHNSFDATTLAELAEALDSMAGEPAVRVVVISSTGRSFCGGAELDWLQLSAAGSLEENQQEAGELAGVLRRIADCPKPVIARVQGSAYGGGVGLVAACDMAVATFDARFALTELRMGLIPAVIAPHVCAAIGERHARRYMLTAEVFSAAEAYRIGLIHEMVADEAALDDAVGEWVETLLNNAPQALTECKTLIRAIAGRPFSAKVVDYTVDRDARLRIAPEAQEGLAAFLEKRPPDWKR